MKFERILLPTDFSDHAAYAQRYAVSLARQYEAQLHLIHVAQLYSYVVDFGVDSTSQYDSVLSTLTQMMDAAVDKLSGEPFPLQGEVIQGEPIQEIVRTARDDHSDLIVMGTHGRSALSHVLLGSIAEKVVRKAPCPVLTVRLPGHDFAMP